MKYTSQSTKWKKLIDAPLELIFSRCPGWIVHLVCEYTTITLLCTKQNFVCHGIIIIKTKELEKLNKKELFSAFRASLSSFWQGYRFSSSNPGPNSSHSARQASTSPALTLLCGSSPSLPSTHSVLHPASVCQQVPLSCYLSMGDSGGRLIF